MTEDKPTQEVEPIEPDPKVDPDVDKQDDSPEELDALRKTASSANREAASLRKRAKAAEAKLEKVAELEKKRAEADMSELEKVNAALVDAQAKLEAASRAAATKDRETLCIKAGVDPDYADVIAAKLDAASPEDTAVWFDELKAKSAAFFGETSTTKPPPRAPGGPSGGRSGQTVVDQIEALVQEQSTLQRSQAMGRSPQREQRQIQIFAELRELRKNLN